MLYAFAIAGATSSLLLGVLHYILNNGKRIPCPVALDRQSYVVPGTEGPNHTAIRRQRDEPHLMHTYNANVHTVYDLFKHSAEHYSNRKCLGRRRKNASGELGHFEWKTYAEVWERVKSLGCGLADIVAGPDNQGLRCVGVYGINRPEWVETDLACQSQSLTPVALYDTLGKGAVEYIVNHASISTVVCSGERIARLIELSPECSTLRTIVSMDTAAVTDDLTAKAKQAGVTLTTLDAVLDAGKHRSPQQQEPRPPSPDDMATIMYTSGTTGNPKGVMVTQRGLLAVAAGVRSEEGLEINENDVHLSYLPLAHIFERAVVCTFLSVGAALGFYSGIIPKLFEDAQELRPTIMVGAPRVFTRLHDKVKQKITSGSMLSRLIFRYAFACKVRALHQRRTTPLLDRIVFSKMQAALGGRVRWIISGSAPLDPEVHRFMEVCFCVKMLQGYGLTETCAGSVVTSFYDYSTGHVGRPLRCCEIRLQDVPEMNYVSRDNRGEVWIRGPSVTPGYFRAEDKTHEVLTDDGWFATGDIGEFRNDGSLAIVDRKKNIFKLEQGEYVAPEYLETVYSSSKFVQQIFVYGNSYRRQLVAIVVPDPEYVEVWAKENNNLPGDVTELCRDDRLKQAVIEDLRAMRQSAGLKGFEMIHNVHLRPEPFSVEEGTMTPTFKLRRFDIKQKNNDILEELYATLS